jgi:hypothetical protein
VTKFKLGILEVVSIEDALVGLDLHSCCPALGLAEAVEADGVRDLEVARRALFLAIQEANDCAAARHAGRASAGDLQTAIGRRTAAALMVPQSETHLMKARLDLERAKTTAVERLKAEAVTRTNVLAAIVKMITPLIEHVREIELRLERTVPGNPDCGWPPWFQ